MDVLVACWSPKGGSGTSVVAAGLAILGRPALLVDLAGDAGQVLGVDDAGPGVVGWAEAGADAPPDALGRLEVRIAEGVHLLPSGGRPSVSVDADRGRLLAGLLAVDPRLVVVDAGRGEGPLERPAVLGADRSLCVIRACSLAIHRCRLTDLPIDDVVVVREVGRATTRRDIESALGARVATTVAWDPEVARTVDSGRLLDQQPWPLRRGLRRLLRAA